ncbi:MAG: hypothetical protein ACOY93_08625 [Bacillota bacterium]
MSATTALSATDTYGTKLTKANDVFLPLIQRQLEGNGIKMDDYAKQCVLAAMSAIHTALESKGTDWNDKDLDKSNLVQVLLAVAALKLNAAAHPREVFFQIRNVSYTARVDGKDEKRWKKQIEMGIEGDGNDAILARFGRDVKKVGQFWLVREHDHFEYPKYNGLEFEPPKWTPTGKGQVVRVVYPIIKTDGSIEFHIAERDDVVRNLLAHINNNLMNETFGIAKNRYDATPQQKREIDAKKRELLKRASELGLGALDDPDLQQWISPAWTEYHSRESMIIRKMRNNIVKRIPKDFRNAFVEITYAEQTDEAEAALRAEVAANANGEVIDIPAEPVVEAGEPVETEPAPAEEPPVQAPPPAPKQAGAKAPVQGTLPVNGDPPY